MSELRVDNIVDMGGSGAPQLRKGANVTGISTITQAVIGNTTINAGGINATGIVTSSSNKFVGDLASGNITAGVMTATSSVVASNITINSGGVNASGIVSATSYQGSGANLTGIGLTIAPLAYNPDVSTSASALSGIGLTFNQRISAGVGTVTLSLVSIGSTVAEVFGLGNATSTTYTVTVASSKFYLDGNLQYSPTLYPGNIYTFDQSAATNGTHPLRFATAADAAGSTEYTTGVETNGTPGSSGAYTRITVAADAPDTLYYYCSNHSNMGSTVSIGANVQYNNDADPPNISITPKTDFTVGQRYALSYPSGAFTQTGAGGSFVGTGYTFTARNYSHQLWGWGANEYGSLGINAGHDAHRSSPVQLPGINWGNVAAYGIESNISAAVKSDGTLWTWGRNANGALGLNQAASVIDYISSPTQVPGTTWAGPVVTDRNGAMMATKTDGTLWAWGMNNRGQLGQNSKTYYSSPVQIPGTTWVTDIGTSDGVIKMSSGDDSWHAIKSDGTLWGWGANNNGCLGLNTDGDHRSSPAQIPGTWKSISNKLQPRFGVKTNGTAWMWGSGADGSSGTNEYEPKYSSPTQIEGGGTTWKHITITGNLALATRTDGTLWGWGNNIYGEGAVGNPDTFPQGTQRSSPIQIGNQTNWKFVQSNASGGAGGVASGMKTDGTLWVWGVGPFGAAGNNAITPANAGYSSPVQVPGTDWYGVSVQKGRIFATKQI